MTKTANRVRSGLAGFLAVAASQCQLFDESWPHMTLRSGLRIYGAVLLVVATLAVVTTARADGWQQNEEITRVAEEFILSQVGKNDSRASVEAGQLDSRLRLPLCDAELTAFLRPGMKISKRTVVGVRCSGSRPWKIYVPVDLVVTESVLVFRKMLPRGHILTADDVVSEDRNVSRLIGGYLTSTSELIGQRLKHQVVGGKVVSPAMLVADTVIKRGQSVTLLVQNNGISISMGGKALTDGALNQRIKVENSTSRRIVEGLVRSPEHVEVLVH